MSRAFDSISDRLTAAITIPTTGSLYAIWRPTFLQSDSVPHILFDVRNAGLTNVFGVTKWSDNIIYAGWYAGAVEYRVSVPSANYTLTQNADNRLFLTWDDAANETRLYLNEVQIGSNLSTLVTWNTGPETCNFGNIQGSTYNLASAVAEFAIWNRVLGADERTVLAACRAPSLIPRGRVYYWPFIRGLEDWAGGVTLTDANTAVADHPRVFYSGSIHYPSKATGVGPQTYARSAVASVAAGDSRVSSLTYPRSRVESVAAVDSRVSQGVFPHARTESSAVSEAVNSALASSRSRSEASVVASVESGPGVFVGTRAEPAAALDAGSSVLTLGASRSESSAMVEVQVSSVLFPATRAESAVVEGAEAVTGSFGVSRVEDSVIADVLASSGVFTASREESSTITVTQALGPSILVASTAEALAVTDAHSGSLILLLSQAETLGANDVLSGALMLLGIGVDVVTVGDVRRGLLEFSAGRAESVGTMDTPFSALVATGFRSDAVGVGDFSSLGTFILGSGADVLGAADTRASQALMALSQVELVGAGDIGNVVGILVRTFTDSQIIEEVRSGLLTLPSVVLEPMGVLDTRFSALVATGSLTDSLGMMDLVSSVPSTTILGSREDLLGVVDVQGSQVATVLSHVASVAVGDLRTSLAIMGLSRVEPMGITDAPRSTAIFGVSRVEVATLGDLYHLLAAGGLLVVGDPNSAAANLLKAGAQANAYLNHPGFGPQPGETKKGDGRPNVVKAPDPSYIPRGKIFSS